MRLSDDANLMLAFACTDAMRRRPEAAPPIELELATESGLQITAPREWLQLMASLGIENVRIRSASSADKPSRRQSRRRRAAPFPRRRHRHCQWRTATPGRQVSNVRPAETRRLFRAPRRRWAGVADRPARPLRSHGKGVRRRSCRSCPTGRLRHAGPAAPRRARPAASKVLAPTRARRCAQPDHSHCHTGRRRSPQSHRRHGPGDRAPQLRTRATTREGPRRTASRFASFRSTPRATPGRSAGSRKPRRAKRPRRCLNFSTSRSRATRSQEAIDAIAPRLKLPIYWDHAALAKDKIDPAKVQVHLPRSRTYYKRILDRVLAQAHLDGTVARRRSRHGVSLDFSVAIARSLPAPCCSNSFVPWVLPPNRLQCRVMSEIRRRVSPHFAIREPTHEQILSNRHGERNGALHGWANGCTCRKPRGRHWPHCQCCPSGRH